MAEYNPYAELTDFNVMCEKRCGFVVNKRYFEGKPRMSRRSCPKCGLGLLQVVDRDLAPVPGWKINPDTGELTPPPVGGGSFCEISIAAATAVLAYDMMSTKPEYAQAPYNRILLAAGLKGSAAGGDSEVAIKVGRKEEGRIFNSGTGFPNKDDMKRLNVRVPANAIVTVPVTDAPGTNPLNLALDFMP